MKSMLNMQMELQAKEKQFKIEETRATGQKVAAEHARFEDDMRAKKQEQIERNQANQRDVKKQIEVRSQLLKSVGSQVIIAGKQH